MNRLNRRTSVPMAVVVFAFVGGMALLSGCAGNMGQASKPGAQLWGENCGRCHNVRPITSYEDSHWEVAVLHMRTRAALTEDEANKIAEFLKSGN